MSREDSRIEGEGGDQDREVVSLPGSDPPPAWRRPAAPARDATGSRPPTADEAADHYAGHLAETSASAFMYFSMAGAGLFRQTDALAYKRYRDRLLADCGSPTDPIEVMLVEQLALAHLNTGRLHHRAATADSLEAARVYGTTAILLMGEFRRGALALKSYRDGPRANELKGTTAVEAYPPSPDAREGADGEQGSKPGDDDHDGATIPLAQEPQAGRGRPIEPGEKARPERRRA